MVLSSADDLTDTDPDGEGSSTIKPLGPDSLMWQYGFPRAGLLIAGRSLLLQVMHPVVGAGVRDFSDFKTDPWGRLDRTVLSLQVQLFGGQRAAEEASRLRKMHARIKGTGFDGSHYSALNQGAYAWVHFSNFDTILAFDRWFAHLLDAEQEERLLGEWRQVGRMLGIREEHMPADIASFGAYVDDMVVQNLVDNPTAQDVLASLAMRDVGPPPWPLFPEPLWRVLKPFGRPVLRDAVVGTLPEAARATLGLRWTDADERRLRAMAALMRTAARGVPDRIMQYPMAYRAVREAKRYRRMWGTR
jgi:uncharacterized protein (DUF2236 family)